MNTRVDQTWWCSECDSDVLLGQEHSCPSALELRELLDAALAREAMLREALRFQDPRNSTERYDRIADDFYRETGLWPPGRSRAAEMGTDPTDPAFIQKRWREFCNEWHERWFDAALSQPFAAAEAFRARIRREALEEAALAAEAWRAPNDLRVGVPCSAAVVARIRALADKEGGT